MLPTMLPTIFKRTQSVKDVSRLKGTFIPEKTLSTYTVIDTDMDGYNGDGYFLFKYRKNQFKNDIIDDYENINLNYQGGRGRSAGPITKEGVEKLYKEGEYEITNKFKFVRINKDGSKSKYKLSNPVKSNIVGYYDYINYDTLEDGTKKQVRNVKITMNTTPKTLKTLKPITKLVDKIYKDLMPEEYNKLKTELDSLGFKEYLYNDCLFTTITVNTDFRTALHRDANNYNKIGMLCCFSSKEEEFKGGELVLPEYNALIKMRPGDVLIFNSNLFHHNNKIEGDGRYSLVYYMRHNIIDLYKNKDSKVNRTYTRDIFIDYNKPVILLKKGYKKIDVVKKALEEKCLIYYLTTKESLNSRVFDKETGLRYRYIHFDKEPLFNNVILYIKE